MVKFSFFTFLAILGFLFVLPRSAHAYLDPGSGSYLLQLILGIVLGGAAGIGIFFKQIKSFMKTQFKRKR